MPRPTMVMVDEFGAVMDSLKLAEPTQYKRVALDLGNLLRLSRSTGISMVFCDQDPSKWPSAMRANLPVNICFKLGGMKGNSVAEYNLNELDRTGHFQVNGERYHAWPTYRVIDSILPGIEYKKPKALLSVQSVHGHVRESVHNEAFTPVRQVVDPPPDESMNSDKGKWYDWSVDYMSKHAELWQTPPSGIREMARQMSVLETGSIDNANRYTGIASSMCKKIRQDAGIGTDVSVMIKENE